MADEPRTPHRRALIRGAAATALTAPLWATGRAVAARPRRGPAAILVFSRTTGFRHASIEVGKVALQQMGDEHGFRVDLTEDPTVFRRDVLAGYQAVVFLNTTGTVLDTGAQRNAFEHYLLSGGGYVGVHSAADTEYEWPFYEDVVGTYFKCHPLQQVASFDNHAPHHPATAHLDDRFTVLDEFYSFRTNPRPDVRVLLTIDESTYFPDPNTTHLPSEDDPLGVGEGETGYMGDHPMSWCHDVGAGRSFYTALGHEPYLYETPWFRQHLLGGIRVAAGQVRG